MATKLKLTDLDAVVAIADADVLHIVDVSDTTQDPDGSSKKVTIEQLREEMGGGAVDSVNGQTGVVELDTDDIDEGATNLYFTSTRFNSSFDTRLAGKNTDNLAEGSSNLYFTNTRFDNRLATKSTSNLSEGSNLYFTTGRVLQTALTGLNVTGTTIVSTDTILEAFGKTQNQINALVGGVSYQGIWDASTNSPALASGVGTKGHYYIVTVAGSTNLDGITDWKLGDWAIFNGSAWNKVDNTDAVITVNGYTGAVVLTTADISENTNLYFTNGRAINALTGQNISIFNNNSGYITSSSLSPYAKLDATNQPFTGNINILKGSPRYTATENVDNATAYFEKLPTDNEFNLTTQNRVYTSADGLTTTNTGGAQRSAVSLGTEYSVEFWTKKTTGTGTFIGQDVLSRYIVNFALSFQIRFGTDNAGGYRYFEPTVVDDDVWTHIIITRNGSTINMYVNGVLFGSGTQSGGYGSVSYRSIGARYDGTVGCAGSWDEVVFHNKELTLSEVQARYNSGAGSEVTDYTNVIAEYRLNAGYTDSSPNSYDMTAVGTGQTFTTGIVSSGVNALSSIKLLKLLNNTTNGSYGDMQLGYYSGTYGTSNVYEGITHKFKILGTEILSMSSGATSISSSLSIGGALSISANNNLTMGIGGGRFFVGSGGSAASPAISQASDTNSGININNDQIDFVTGGTVRVQLSNSTTRFQFGSIAVPGIGFTGDTDQGIYGGGGYLGISAGNYSTVLWTNATTTHNNTTSNIFNINGVETLRLNTVGVGISLTNVKAKLHSAVSVAGGTHNASLIINNLNAGTGGLATGPYTGIDFSHLNDQASDIQRKMAVGFEKITTFSRGDMVVSLCGTADNTNVNYIADEKMRLTMAGNLGIGTIGTTITAMLDINSDVIRLRTAKTPASATATGNQGDICWDANYIYVATGTNTWKRGAIATW